MGPLEEEKQVKVSEAALKDADAPALVAAREHDARARFWPKLRAAAGRIPFADDLAAAYYCALDPATPTRVRGVLLAAVAYFIVPTDAIPDFIAAFGFSDDASVAMAALGVVGGHIKPSHRARARAALGLSPIDQADANAAAATDPPRQTSGETPAPHETAAR